MNKVPLRYFAYNWHNQTLQDYTSTRFFPVYFQDFPKKSLSSMPNYFKDQPKSNFFDFTEKKLCHPSSKHLLSHDRGHTHRDNLHICLKIFWIHLYIPMIRSIMCIHASEYREDFGVQTLYLPETISANFLNAKFVLFVSDAIRSTRKAFNGSFWLILQISVVIIAVSFQDSS